MTSRHIAKRHSAVTMLLVCVLMLSMSMVIVQKTGANTIRVPYDYSTIQEAINAASSGDTIFVYNGTYNENIVVNQTVSLIGENKRTTFIDGKGSGTVVTVTSNNVNITGFTIQNGSFAGIYLGTVNNSRIIDNTITNPSTTSSFYGVAIWYQSKSNIVSGNIITNNVYGIGLEYFSSDNIVSGNTIANNRGGIRVYYSSDNLIYHNDFINNPVQVNIVGSSAVWDDGYPSGGNYWSDYTGVDADGDGIGDTPYIIDASNQDRYPLMTPFTTLYVTITGFAFIPQNLAIQPGDTVVWKNNDPIIYTLWFVNISDKSTYLLSDPINPGETWLQTFPDSVRLRYYDFNRLWIIGFLSKLAGDVGGPGEWPDGKVDIRDAFIMGKAYDSYPGQPNWNPNADINQDNIVNQTDLSILAQNYGEIDP